MKRIKHSPHTLVLPLILNVAYIPNSLYIIARTCVNIIYNLCVRILITRKYNRLENL